MKNPFKRVSKKVEEPKNEGIISQLNAKKSDTTDKPAPIPPANVRAIPKSIVEMIANCDAEIQPQIQALAAEMQKLNNQSTAKKNLIIEAHLLTAGIPMSEHTKIDLAKGTITY